MAIADRMAGVCIENRPACEVMVQHDGPDTLHYVDPPYPLSTRSIGNPHCKKGYRHEMTDDDHRVMAATLRNIDGAVVLSGYACDLYDLELFPDWYREERPALADGARPRTEVLWFNREPSSLFGMPTIGSPTQKLHTGDGSPANLPEGDKK
jgi:DNA adenine methylase